MPAGSAEPIGTVKYQATWKQYRIKVACAPGSRRPHEWITLQRYVWQRDVGDIPPGHVIHVKNGDPEDMRLENLECISRAETLARYRIQLLYPKPMQAVLRANKKLKRIIDEKQN